jgi:sec-independent protein translocase protein TatA
MPNLGTTELIIILVIVIIVFGVGRIGKIGGELGQGIREFRKGLAEGTEDQAQDEKEEE